MYHFLAAPPEELILSFCDESRITEYRYRLFGGVILLGSDFAHLESLASNCQWSHEFKWQRISKASVPKYKDFLNVMFNNSHRMYFHSIIIDTHQIINGIKGDEDLFYSQYYHLLVYSLGKYVEPTHPWIIKLHQRTTKYPYSQLMNIVNNGMRKNYNRCPNTLVRSLVEISAEGNPFIQWVDVCLGALGYWANGLHERTNASPAKIEIMRYIFQKAGITSPAYSTPKSKHDFGIWRFQYRKTKTP